MANLYCTATNSGKGFYTNLNTGQFALSGHSGDVWVVENNNHGIAWINRVNGTAKTKAEAQAIVDEKTNAYQIVWDAANIPVPAPEAGTDEEKELYSMRQGTYTLP